MKKTKIVCVYNYKGGVGKTTFVKNVGVELAKTKKVLLIDLDPQGNLSNQFISEATVFDAYDVLMTQTTLKQAVEKTKYENLDILTSSLKMLDVNQQIMFDISSQRETRLQNKLVSSDYDYIFIDCAPAKDILVMNALVASDEVIIPLKADMYSLEGIKMLLEFVNSAKNINNNLKISSAFLNMYEKTKVAEEFLEVVSNILPELTKTYISKAVQINSDTFTGAAIVDSSHKVAKQYKDLIQEMGLK